MIILSQDKSAVVDFTGLGIGIKETIAKNEERFVVCSNGSGLFVYLGKYKTEEKAKEIVCEIYSSSIAGRAGYIMPSYECGDAKHRYRFATHSEFMSIKTGDTIFYLSHKDEILETKALNPSFWNYDSDEPGWEIETEDGYICENDVMIRSVD